MSNGNFLVWHKGKGLIFIDETQSMDFIYKAIEENPELYFSGWVADNPDSISVTYLSNRWGNPPKKGNSNGT